MRILAFLLFASVAMAEPIQFQQPIYSGSGVDFGPTGETITGLVDLDERYVSQYNGCSTYTCRFESDPALDHGAAVMIWGYNMDTEDPEPWWMSGIYWDEAIGLDIASYGSTLSPSVPVPEPSGLLLLIGGVLCLGRSLRWR